MPVDIVGPVNADVQDCERILRALPAYFGIEEALLQYLKGIEDMPVFFALRNDETLRGYTDGNCTGCSDAS